MNFNRLAMKRALEGTATSTPAKRFKASLFDYHYGTKIITLSLQEHLYVKQYSLPIFLKVCHIQHKIIFDFSWLQEAVNCGDAETAKWLTAEVRYQGHRNNIEEPMIYLHWSRMFDWLRATQTITRIMEMAAIVKTSPLYHPNIFYKYVLIYAIGYYPDKRYDNDILTFKRAKELIAWVKEQTQDQYESIWASVDFYWYPSRSNCNSEISLNICELLTHGLMPINSQNLLACNSNTLLEYVTRNQDYHISSDMFIGAFDHFDMFITDNAHWEDVSIRIINRLNLLKNLRENRAIELNESIAFIYLKSLLNACKFYRNHGFVVRDVGAYHATVAMFDWFKSKKVPITQTQLDIALYNFHPISSTEFGFYLISYFLNEGFYIHPFLLINERMTSLNDLKNGLIPPENMINAFISNSNESLIASLYSNPYATELYFKNFAAADIVRILEHNPDNGTISQAAFSLCYRNPNNFNMHKLILYMHPKIYPRLPEDRSFHINANFFKFTCVFKEGASPSNMYVPNELWVKVSSYLTVADIRLCGGEFYVERLVRIVGEHNTLIKNLTTKIECLETFIYNKYLDNSRSI